MRNTETTVSTPSGEPKYKNTVVAHAHPKDLLADVYFTYGRNKICRQIDVIPLVEGM